MKHLSITENCGGLGEPWASAIIEQVLCVFLQGCASLAHNGRPPCWPGIGTQAVLLPLLRHKLVAACLREQICLRIYALSGLLHSCVAGECVHWVGIFKWGKLGVICIWTWHWLCCLWVWSVLIHQAVSWKQNQSALLWWWLLTSQTSLCLERLHVPNLISMEERQQKYVADCTPKIQFVSNTVYAHKLSPRWIATASEVHLHEMLQACIIWVLDMNSCIFLNNGRQNQVEFNIQMHYAHVPIITCK